MKRPLLPKDVAAIHDSFAARAAAFINNGDIAQPQLMAIGLDEAGAPVWIVALGQDVLLGIHEPSLMRGAIQMFFEGRLSDRKPDVIVHVAEAFAMHLPNTAENVAFAMTLRLGDLEKDARSFDVLKVDVHTREAQYSGSHRVTTDDNGKRHVDITAMDVDTALVEPVFGRHP